MSNITMTNKERLARLETLMIIVKDDVEEIKRCILPLKVKVYTGAGLITILIMAAGYFLKVGL